MQANFSNILEQFSWVALEDVGETPTLFCADFRKLESKTDKAESFYKNPSSDQKCRYDSGYTSL